MEHSRVDSTGSPVRSEPPPETDEQRATPIYEEKLKRYNEVANELKSSRAKVSDVHTSHLFISCCLALIAVLLLPD